ncbi:MAG: post-COAP-1 domain-containing protein [Acidobacteriota bacterium]
MATGFLCPRLGRIKILCLLSVIILTAFSAVITAQSTLRLGIPSLTTTDGRFLAIAGTAASTLGYVPTIVYIGAASTATSVDIGIFDGDIGGSWDYVPDAVNPPASYRIFADPNKDGTGPLITTLNGAIMPDNAWFIHNIDLTGPQGTLARNSQSGNYFFRIEVEFSIKASNSVNGFKIGTSGQPSLAAIGQIGFVAAPINPFDRSPSSYNGSWDFYLYAPGPLSSASFLDGDADSGADATPGPDADIQYIVHNPSGSQHPNNNPSGDSDWEQFVLLAPGSTSYTQFNDPAPSEVTIQTVSSLPAGFYRWQWNSVDRTNLVQIRSDLEMYMTDNEAPLSTGPPTSSDQPNVDISPDNTVAANQGDLVTFNHTITQTGTGNSPYTFDLTAAANPLVGGLVVVEIRNATTGLPLVDTNMNGVVDTGPMRPGDTLAIEVDVLVGATAPDNSNVTITASTRTDPRDPNSVVFDSAVDTVDLPGNEPPPGGGGLPPIPPGGGTCAKVTGGGIRTAGASGGFNVHCDKSGVKGELQFQNNVTNFHAHRINSLVVSLDLKKAWFSGVGKDGRSFDAYVEDNGEPGKSDVYMIAINGVLQIGSGPVSGGNIQIHK